MHANDGCDLYGAAASGEQDARQPSLKLRRCPPWKPSARLRQHALGDVCAGHDTRHRTSVAQVMLSRQLDWEQKHASFIERSAATAKAGVADAQRSDIFVDAAAAGHLEVRMQGCCCGKKLVSRNW